MIKRKFISLLFMITLSALLLACDANVSESPKESAVRPAKLITIETATGIQTSRYPAVIGAGQSSDLAFQVGGLLQELLVNEAQQIKQGAVIAKLDQRDFHNNVASAKAQYTHAEEEYQRAVRLTKEDAIAKNILEQRQSQRDVAKAQLDSAEKALSDTVLTAPFSGVVTKVPAKRLQNVQPGNLIATLINGEVLEATVNLPASVIANVPQRNKEGAFVVLDAAPSKQIPATFKEATLEADAVSQTYEVSFTFQPPEALVILPGMNATVILSSSAKQASQTEVAVPLAALMSEGGQQFVWVVDTKSMMVSKRRVTVEEGIGETMLVTAGLSPGDTIVGAGAAYLSEGIQVRPWAR